MHRLSLAAPLGAVLALSTVPVFAQDVLSHNYPEGATDRLLEPIPSPFHHYEFLIDPLPVPLAAVDPLGSFVYRSCASGRLAVILDSDDFESGALGAQWSTATSAPEGRIQVTDAFGAASGQFALLMDVTVNGVDNLNEAIWTVDLSGVTDATLTFAHADFNDEETFFAGPFAGSFDADGVAISEDGVNWFPVFDAPSQAFGVWEAYEIDLGAAAALAGISLGANFQIKFQQFDNFALTTDGRGYDAIAIEVPGIDADQFTFDVDPGQTVTLVVDPQPGIQPVVSLSHNGAVLGTAAAAAPGEDAVLQVVPTSGSLTGFGGQAKSYVATVTGTTAATGSYDLCALVNTAVEAESHDGPTNDTLATAENLAQVFQGLHSAVRSAQSGPKPDRAAVVGDLGGVVAFSDGFESGALGPEWSTFSSDPNGRIQVSGASGTAAGSFAVLMDRDPSGTSTLNEIVLTVDLSGMSEARLEFFHAEFGDETHNFAGPFVDHFDADGVAISADGTNWFPVLDMPNQTSGDWVRYEVDLTAEAAAAGIGLGANFQIKFQQFDNFPIPTDGRGWDEISIVGPADDYYCIPLEARETLSLGATALSGAAVAIELLDAAGNVVASGGGSGIVNGGFETGDFTGWTTATTGTPFRPWAVTGAGMGGGFDLDPTQPQEGINVAWNGFDGSGPMEFTMFQDIMVGANRAELRWWDRAQWNFTLGGTANLPRLFDVEIRDPATNAVLATLLSFSTGTQATNPTGDTGWIQHSADLSAFAGQTVRLFFREQIPEASTGPAQLEIDGIGFSSASNLDAIVRNFTAGSAGTYYVRVFGTDPNSSYSLVAHRNADFGIEDNDSPATADPLATRIVSSRMWLAGHVDDAAGDARDFHAVSLDPRKTLKVQTYTPGDGAGVFLNDLDPMLRLYDAAGNLLAEDDNSTPDGRNAALSYRLPKGAGPSTLFVEVLASPATAPTSGPFVIAVSGNN